MSLPAKASFRAVRHLLGDSVPSHWSVSKLGYRVEVQLGKMLDARQITGDHLRPYLRNTDVQWGRINVADLPEMDFDEGDRRKFALRTGDILVCEGGEIGRAAIWNGEIAECYYQKALHRLRPIKGDESRFIYWSVAAAAQGGAFSEGANRTTIEHLPAEKLRAHVFPFPPVSEQRAIADFLDHETARIDLLIAKQQALIGTAVQKREAEEDFLLTRGASDGRLLPSPITWMGDAPAHWDFVRAKFLFKERSDLPRPDDGVVTAFRDGQVTLRANRRSEGFTFAKLEVGYQRVFEGDLVIHTMDAFAGAVGVSESTGKCTGEYAVCIPKDDRANNHYYAHLLRLMARRGYIYVLCPSVRERAPRYRFVRFADTLLPVPPRVEQDRIVSRLTDIRSRYRSLVERCEAQVGLLQEHRSALITAAVTGRIEVAANIAAEVAA